MMAVTVTDTMKVTANIITATAPVDSPDIPLPVKYNEVMITLRIRNTPHPNNALLPHVAATT